MQRNRAWILFSFGDAKSVVKAVDLCQMGVGGSSLWGGMQDARKTLLYNYNLLFVFGFFFFSFHHASQLQLAETQNEFNLPMVFL